MTIEQLFRYRALLIRSGRESIAEGVVHDWLGQHRQPQDAIEAFNFGVVLRQESAQDAIWAYDMALAISPMMWQAAVNKGLALESMGRLLEAVSVWHQYVKSPHPPQTTLLNHIGRVLEQVKRLSKAEQFLGHSLRLDPLQTDTMHHFLHLRRMQCAWPVVPDWLKALRDEADLLLDSGPFGGLAHFNDPAEQRKTTARYVQRKLPQNITHLPPPPNWEHKQLRIGYFSADFKAHAVSILMTEVLELHNRDRVRVYGLDYSDRTPNVFRNRVIQAFDVHVPLHDLTDEEAAACIREHEIDVLVDLTGLTAESRWPVLLYRPSVLQVGHLGFMGTSCIPTLDAVLVDKTLFPPELGTHFSEKPLFLECYQANDRLRKIGPPKARIDCGLQNHAFVFCAFHNTYKINETVWRIWLRILQAVPNSVLWLLDQNQWSTTALTQSATEHGISTDRLIFSKRTGTQEYLARLQCADLFLDTWPYNAGTTASDALWAGLPVLACPGPSLVSRMSASLLTAAGLPELIANSPEAYERLAIELAWQPDRLSSLKQRLTDHRDTCLLFDTPRYVANLEEVLIQAHAEQVAQLRPEASSTLQPTFPQADRITERA